jgi:hypothetical protein
MRKVRIKTFSVNADIYSELIAMFKKYDVDVSLSSYVDSCLRGLNNSLKRIESVLEANSKVYSVPMPYVIEETVRGSSREAKGNMEDEDTMIFDVVDSWQEEYESRKSNIPVNILRFIKTGLFELSKDKKSLIRKDTGEKYIIVNGKVWSQEDILKMAAKNKKDDE